MSTIIKAENLGKKYIIGHQKQRYDDSFRDAMTHTARGIWQRVRHPLSPNRESVDLEELWALKDIDFEVKQGARVGIIGRNGAGKSTLLKVLSRITEPTTGKVRIKGRVSSLLEVGTGFHPELTGRENIFLNGAILGMTRQEIKSKFDEIIAFAELEKFLDTPVKRYSSGMYVRLAFAVAAHLEPEILIVDEVLAVGDAAFQKKCLGKMEDVAGEGRTVLFVSHNMSAVNALCYRCIHLDKGEIANEGETHSITEGYYATLRQLGSAKRTRDLDKCVYITEWTLVDGSGSQTNVVYTGEYFCVEVIVENTQPSCEVALGVSIEDVNGTRLFGGLSVNENRVFHLELGVSKLRYSLDNLPLNEGIYYLTIAIHNEPSNIILDRLDNCMSFEVVNRKSAASGRLINRGNGIIIVDAKWLKVT